MVTATSTLTSIFRKVTISLIGIVLLLAVQPAAKAQGPVYIFAVGCESGAGNFGNLNLMTGAFTGLGQPGQVTGLGRIGSILYAAQTNGDTLYQVDQGNGNLIAMGTGNIVYVAFGSTTTGLYALDPTNYLYSIVATGDAKPIGQTGIPLGGRTLAMSTDGSQLYAATDDGKGTQHLYRIDTTTGATTDIGDTGLLRITSMVFAYGSLYADQDYYTTGELFTLDTQTAAATFVAYSGECAAGMSALPASSFSTLYSFPGGLNGSTPWAGVTLDPSGNLYGTTSAGGLGYGTAFKLKRAISGWTFNPLYQFQGGNDGAIPRAGVVLGPDGTLYGTTTVGGGSGCSPYFHGCGTVFNLKPAPTFCKTALCGWDETVIHRFSEGDGAIPGYGNLTFDSEGNIYGTTQYGGSRGGCYYQTYACGTVFEMTRSGGSWNENVLYNFAAGGDGGEPLSGVTFDQAGNLYGTNPTGGVNSGGVVYQLVRSGSGWTQSVLANFPYAANAYGGVIVDHADNLYGATANGGSDGQGFAYELSPGDNWTLDPIYMFSGEGSKNSGIWSNLVMGSDGSLYGTTQGWAEGGDYGTVFKLTLVNGVWT